MVLQKGNNIILEKVLFRLESLEPSRADNDKLEKASGGTVSALGSQQNAGAGDKGDSMGKPSGGW